MYRSTTTGRAWFRLDRHDDPATGTDPAGGAVDPTTGTDPAAGGKPADDPGKTPTFTGEFDKERAERALAAARQAEKDAKAQAQQANDQLAKVMAALGRAPDGSEATADPDQLAAELTAQAAQARLDAWKAGTTLALYQIAGPLGADVEELLDSTKFLNTLDDLLEDEPGTPEFTETLRGKVQAALEQHPTKYRTAAAGPRTPGPDPSQGRGGTSAAPDFRTADKATFDAELGKFGLRPRSYS